MHCFLLPLFFVLHNYMQYYGLVPGPVATSMLGTIELIFMGAFVVVLLLSRNINKSLLIVTAAGIPALFYGVVKDFISGTLQLPLLAKYTVLLPAVLVMEIIIMVWVSRKKDFRKINFFLNLLLLVFIAMDGFLFFRSENDLFLQQNLLTKKDTLASPPAPVLANTPDVYYLLFDCYPGTDFLQHYLGYDNMGLDSALKEKGFHVLNHPSSNYNRTAFSMAATLNFNYLKGIHSYTRVTAQQYKQTVLTVQYASAPEYFQQCGYELYNLSIFDIAAHPSMLKESFLTLPGKNMLLYNTISERIRRDIGWNFTIGRFARSRPATDPNFVPPGVISTFLHKRDFNHTVADSLEKIAAQKTARPKFIYAHLYLPHPPFFYDKDGKSNDIHEITSPAGLVNKELFFSYLQYSNKVMLSLANHILKESSRPPVIIIQSDHGCRDFSGVPFIPALCFTNYSAFYFPDKNYSMLYDSMSNVNTFPIVFNKYFNTHIPLARDSSIFLGY